MDLLLYHYKSVSKLFFFLSDLVPFLWRCRNSSHPGFQLHQDQKACCCLGRACCLNNSSTFLWKNRC